LKNVFINVFVLVVLLFLYVFSSCLIVVPVIGVWGFGLLDSYSSLLGILTVCVGFYILNYRSFGYVLKFLLGSLLILLVISFSVSKFLVFYVFFELSLVPMVIVILGWGLTPERLKAGSYILLYTLVSSTPLFFVLLQFFRVGESLMFYSSGCFCSPDSSLFGVGWFLLFFLFGFFVKVPVYGFHLWLAKAHVEAPVYGSMILAAVFLKLGLYGLIRSLDIWNFSGLGYANYLVVFFLFGLLLAGLVCFRQVDIKSLIAYSSVQHMMLAMVSLFSYSEYSYLGILFVAVSHGFVSRALFFLFNSIYEFTGTRNLLLNRGLINIFPCFIFVWGLSLCLNSAFPPSGKYFSEIFLVSSVVKIWFMVPFFVVLSVFVSGLFSLYLYTVTSHGKWNVLYRRGRPLSLLNIKLGVLQCLPSLFACLYFFKFVC
jgi:NADH:ubiquinone oxidoreductase subunit 4 (subunit M)